MNDFHNPDVLSCLANLSNDEVFTPPKVVNDMLDLLPREVFESSKTTFLDIGCKSGVFLREIAKRLIVGLEKEIPDLQTRVDHILHHQLYGIATTELTSLVSRRTLYCSKYPNCRYSASRFDNVEGNIRFRNVPHEFVGGRCKWCGASEEQFGKDKREGLETHAYEFIHTTSPKEIFNMKFDVIVGNPPYQLNVGVEQESYAVPLYHKFIQQAKKLNPRYLSMIIPSRWFAGGRGLDDFRDEMLHDNRIRVLHDFLNASEVFGGVEIKGGVCYFLWDRDKKGDCDITTHHEGKIVVSNRPLLEDGNDTFVRYSEAIPILRKIRKSAQSSFAVLVSPQTPFGLYSSFKDYTLERKEDGIRVYGNKFIGYLNNNVRIEKNKEWIKTWKVLVPKAIGSGDMSNDVIKPLIVAPNSVCTQTYIMFGPFKTKKECENVVSYVQTRFFHFMVGLRKVTQDAMAKVYQFVPMQDFSKPWTDEELYAKYKLTKDEIAFIESMIKPME